MDGDIAVKKSNMIKNYVRYTQQICSTAQFQELKRTSPKEYEDNLRKIFPTFARSFEALFEMVIRGDDMTMLNRMLDQYVGIKSGKIRRDVGEKKIGEMLAKTYIK